MGESLGPVLPPETGGGGGGSGTVTSVSIVSTNGFAGTVATATTTPAITLETTVGTSGSPVVLAGNGTSVVTALAAYFPTLNQNTTGTAANLSGTPALPNGTTATTQASSDTTTKLATDAFVQNAIAANGPMNFYKSVTFI
jgi:hypothetical protein